MKPREQLERRIDAMRTILSGQPLGVVTLDGLRLKSANVQLRGVQPGHMHAKRDATAQLRLVGTAAAAKTGARRWLGAFGNLVIHLVRQAPRPLDDDNLAASFKALRDGFAQAVRIDDGDPRVIYVTTEETARDFGVRVEVFALGVARAVDRV